MKKYTVYFTLAETYEVEYDHEALDLALTAIEDREGMEIIKHEIIEQLDKSLT